MKLAFNINFKSDYHIGAGYGLPPEVDSALHRDPDGVPVIRGTVLAGLLRQGLYDLLQLPPLQQYRYCKASGAPGASNEYCGQWGHSEEICPVCAIFGTPNQMKRWRISSARPQQLASSQKQNWDWQAGETGAQITPRVRVNPRTRRAESNKLFSREEGDGRLSFVFTIENLSNDPASWEQAAWLVAAARMVRRLGAGKRRGLGECEISLMEGKYSQEVLIDRLADILNGVASPPARTTSLPIPDLESPQGNEHSYRIQMLLRTDEPLLVHKPSLRRREVGGGAILVVLG